MAIVYQRTPVISVLCVCERSRWEVEHLWRRCSFPTRSMFFPNRIQSGYRLAAAIYSGNGYDAVQSSSRLVAKAPSDTPRRTPPRQTSPPHSPSEPSTRQVMLSDGRPDRWQTEPNCTSNPAARCLPPGEYHGPSREGCFGLLTAFPALCIVNYHHHHNESGVIALRLIPSGDLFPSSAVLAS